MVSARVLSFLVLVNIVVVAGSSSAGEPKALADDVLDQVSAGAYAGYAAGGLFTVATQSGAGSTSTTQHNLNTVSNKTTISSSGIVTTSFSANSRVKGTVNATGTGVSTATAVGVSSVGANQVVTP